MGLERQDTKTRYAHTLEAQEEGDGNVGFDFLNFTIRQFPVVYGIFREFFGLNFGHI